MTDTATLGVQKCDRCNQSDTDPMIHLAYAGWTKEIVVDDETLKVIVPEPSFHYDCLPDEFKPDLDLPQNATTFAGIAAAESGVKGEALREFLFAQPDDNQVEPVPADNTQEG